MEENLVLKLRNFFITKLEVLPRAKTGLKDLHETSLQKNPSFQTQEKSGCAIKIVNSAFIFLANNNVWD